MRILPYLVSALAGVMLGLGVFTFQYAQGLSYFSNDPKACANCHIMRDHLDSWQKSSHHTRATCNDCHTPHSFIGKVATKADNGWNHGWRFTAQTFGDPVRIRPVNVSRVQENCTRCHQDLTDDIRAGSAHATGDLNCMHCHAGVGHGPRR